MEKDPSPGPYTAPPAVFVYCLVQVEEGGVGSERAVILVLVEDVLVVACVVVVPFGFPTVITPRPIVDVGEEFFGLRTAFGLRTTRSTKLSRISSVG